MTRSVRQAVEHPLYGARLLDAVAPQKARRAGWESLWQGIRSQTIRIKRLVHGGAHRTGD